jgi:hypothetical protein
VPGRHEGRQVLEPVRVDAPPHRAHELPERRDRDDGEGLDPDAARMERQEHSEHARGQQPQAELPRVPNVPVGEQPAGRPRGDDGEREVWEAAHHAHLRRCAGAGSAVPRSSDSTANAKGIARGCVLQGMAGRKRFDVAAARLDRRVRPSTATGPPR